MAMTGCLHLRDSKDLGEQAMSMVRLVLPVLAGSIEHRVQQLPAVATISKGRAAVDVGLMLFMKQVNDSLNKSCGGFLVRTLLSDSSPQRKYDWLMSEVHTFSGSVILDIIQIVLELSLLRQAQCPDKQRALQHRLDGLLEQRTGHEAWAPPCCDTQHICVFQWQSVLEGHLCFTKFTVFCTHCCWKTVSSQV